MTEEFCFESKAKTEAPLGSRAKNLLRTLRSYIELLSIKIITWFYISTHVAAEKIAVDE